jgi:hypothetical protein
MVSNQGDPFKQTRGVWAITGSLPPPFNHLGVCGLEDEERKRSRIRTHMLESFKGGDQGRNCGKSTTGDRRSLRETQRKQSVTIGLHLRDNSVHSRTGGQTATSGISPT